MAGFGRVAVTWVLGIDTSGRFPSAALVASGAAIAGGAIAGGTGTGGAGGDLAAVVRTGATMRGHAADLQPLIADVLAEADVGFADLVGIGVARGPGLFTGLRVGLVAAQTIGFARDLPVLGVSTLAALAERVLAGAGEPNDGGATGRAEAAGPFGIATDARRKEVFWAAFDEAGQRTSGDAVARPDQVPLEQVPRWFVDSGAGRLGIVGEPLDTDALAAEVAVLTARLLCGVDLGSQSADLLALLAAFPPHPLYLRRPDVTTPSSVKSVLATARPSLERDPQSRGLQPNDAPATAAIDAEAFGSRAWNLDQWREELRSDPDRWYQGLFDSTGDLLGYVGLRVAGGQADLITIALANRARGRGLGARLLQSCIDQARQRRAADLFLEVDEDNAAARRLYTSRGFTELGIRRHYYGPDQHAVAMRLVLREPLGAQPFGARAD